LLRRRVPDHRDPTDDCVRLKAEAGEGKGDTATAMQRRSRMDAMMMGAVAGMAGLLMKLFGRVR
jgi:hypothetical protein